MGPLWQVVIQTGKGEASLSIDKQGGDGLETHSTCVYKHRVIGAFLLQVFFTTFSGKINSEFVTIGMVA